MKSLIFALITATNLPVVPNVAPGYGAPPVAPGPPQIVGITQQQFVGITLQDAVSMALLKNPDLAIAAGNVRIAGYQIAAAKGAYDINFMLEPSVTHAETAPQNAFFAGPNFGAIVQNRDTLQTGINGQLPSGTQYGVSLSTSKVDDNTIINSFNPYYPTALSLSLTQPLLRDFRSNPVQHQISLAVIGEDATQAQTLSSAAQTVAQVQDAYWDLVAAWRNVAIQEDALKQAIAQQGSTQRLAKRGQAANIDAVESQEQVATFEDAVYSGLQNVATLQNGLKSLIVTDPADPIWRANLLPTSPVQQLPPVPTLDALVAAAMQQRPEVRAVADSVRQADENAKFARNQSLPRVDVIGGWTSNGFAGQPVSPQPALGGGPPAKIPGYLVGSDGKSISNTLDNKFPTYNLGVKFSKALGDNTGKANLAIARQQQQNAAISQRSIGERIEAESRNALQTYQAAVARLAAARTARQTSEAVLASETRKFHNGVSTTFLVLQRQVELQQARGRELQAQTDLNKAVVELQRVSGNILSQNNVTLSTLGQEAMK